MTEEHAGRFDDYPPIDEGCIAIGNNARATVRNSVAIGANVQCVESNEINIANRFIMRSGILILDGERYPITDLEYDTVRKALRTLTEAAAFTTLQLHGVPWSTGRHIYSCDHIQTPAVIKYEPLGLFCLCNKCSLL